MALALITHSPALTAAERSAVAEAFRSLEAARRLRTSHARTVALELAERRVVRARAILAAAHRRGGSGAKTSFTADTQQRTPLLCLSASEISATAYRRV